MKTNETYTLSYIKGTLSAREMKEFNILMDSSPEFAAKVNQIRKTYHLFDNLESQNKINTTVAWQKMNKKIRLDKTKKVIWNFSRNAAAILLPLFLMLQYVVQPLLKNPPQQVGISVS